LGFTPAADRKDLKRRVSALNFYFVSARAVEPQDIFNRRTSIEMLLMFTHRLGALIGSGIPILSAMNILWRQTDDETLQLVVSHVRRKLEEGDRISEALDDFPRVFPPLYRALVKVSEQTGQFVPILKRLTDQLEAQRQFVTRMKKVTLYPAFVLSFAALVVLAVFLFVVPFFQKIMSQLTDELPVFTQVLVNISEVMRSWPFWAGVLITVVVLFLVSRMPENKALVGRLSDEIKARIPVWGEVRRMLNVSQFLHSMSALLSAGVAIVQSFEVAKTTLSDHKLVVSVEQIQRMVEQGSSVYNAFEKVKSFPVMANELIGAGEMSGKLAVNFDLVAKHLDEEIDYKINKFLTLLEPMLVIFIGLAVLITLLALYVPIFSMWEILLK